MDLGNAGTQAKFVLHDRDASFTEAFDAVFQAAGIRVIRYAVQRLPGLLILIALSVSRAAV